VAPVTELGSHENMAGCHAGGIHSLAGEHSQGLLSKFSVTTYLSGSNTSIGTAEEVQHGSEAQKVPACCVLNIYIHSLPGSAKVFPWKEP